MILFAVTCSPLEQTAVAIHKRSIMYHHLSIKISTRITWAINMNPNSSQRERELWITP